MNSPRLQTDRLIIKSLDIGDAQALFRYRSDPAVYRYQLWRPVDRDEAEQFIKRFTGHEFGAPHTWYQLGLYLIQTSALIGDVGLHFREERHHSVEVGYSLAPEFHRQGYAFEALQEIIAYLFETMGKRRVTASVDPGNAASVALLKKLGMRKEAHFHQSRWLRGERVDDINFAILRSEWKPRVA